MRIPKRRYLFGALLLGTVAFQSPDANAIIIYDSNLTSPDPNPLVNPGFFNGTGNPDGGFTLYQGNGIEIGLRAKHRGDANVIHTPTNIYDVPTGPQDGANLTRAWWNYEFAVDLRPGGTGSLLLSDIVPYSTFVIEDLIGGYSRTVAMPYWFDSETWGASGEGNLASIATWDFQNSENATFGDWPLNSVPGYPGFNMNNSGVIRISANVATVNGALGSDQIIVRIGDAQIPTAVPEPATMALFGFGLFGLVRMGAKKRRKEQQALAA